MSEQVDSKPYLLEGMSEAACVELTRKVLDSVKYDKKPWRKFKLVDVLKPTADCLVHGPSWWCVTSDGCVLAFNNTLQCNTNEKLSEMLRSRIHISCTLQYFEMLYIPLRSWEI